MRKVSDKVV